MKPSVIAFIIVTLIALVGIGAYALSKDSTEPIPASINSAPDTSSQPSQSSTPKETATDTNTALTKSEVATHNSKNDCWTIINNDVYDITSYVPRHPGGDEILQACGTDGTTLFTQRKDADGSIVGSGTPHSSTATRQLQSFKIGTLAE